MEPETNPNPAEQQALEAAAAAAEVEAQAQQPAEGEKPAEAKPMSEGQAKRNAIYEKRAAQLTAEVAANPEQAARMAEMAGQQAPAQEAIQESATASEKTLAVSGETRKLQVDGTEIEVPLDKVLEAGVRALQKETSADVRLERAANAERLAQARSAEADERERKIAEREARISSGLPDQGVRGAEDRLPQGVEAHVDKEILEQAQEALFDGDQERSEAILRKAITESVKTALGPNGRGKSEGAGEAGSTAGRPRGEVDAANSVFETVFPEIVANGPVFAQAAARMRQAMSDPLNAGIPLHKLAMQVGTEVRKTISTPAAASSANGGSSGTGVQSRTDLKLAIPAMPNRQNTRSADSQPAATRPLTRSEVFQQMNAVRLKSRGINPA